MSRPTDHASRIAAADVIFVAQDGYTLAPARVRCYSFAKLLNQRGLRAEVLSFHDHLGAPLQGSRVNGMPLEDRLRFNAAAVDLLALNPRAVIYLQKTGYHTLACMIAAGRNGNPIILDYDDYDLECHSFCELETWLPDLAPDRLLRSVASRAYACIASSRSILDIVAPYNPRAILIHTVADQEVFTTQGRDRPRSRLGDAVNILWCGDVWGHIPMKDLFFAAEAFAALPAAVREQARFHIIGFGGAWETTRERLRRRYQGEARLVLHDFTPPAEMPGVFRETDIGVLPYFDNAFNRAKSPTKMFEYMLSGVTVLSTPVGEAALCLEDGQSVLLAEGVDAFAAALARLIEDPALRRRLAAAARVRALAEYSLQGVGACLENTVRGALAARRGASSGFSTPDAFMAEALGRRRPVASRETALALNDLRMLARSPDLAAENPRRWSAPLLALLDWPGLMEREGVTPAQAAQLRSSGAALRGAARWRPRLRLPPANRPAGPPALCKLAAAEDWEDPAWFHQLDGFKTNLSSFSGDGQGGAEDEDRLNHTYNFFKRSRGAWERAHLLYGLERLGLLDVGAQMLVGAAAVDGFYLYLTERAGHVDVVNLGPGPAACAAAAGKRDPWLAKPRLYYADRLTIRHGGGDVVSDRQWDAAIILQAAADRLNDPAFVARLAAGLKPDGVLAFCLPLRLDLSAASPQPPSAVLQAGFAPLDGFDASISDATLDRTVQAGTADAANPHFAIEDAAGLFMPAIWFCRRDRS